MAKEKIYHIDHIVAVFAFILIAVAGFMYFSTVAMTNTRAAQKPQSPKEAALKCYNNRKPEICPEKPPKPGDDKDLKICTMCYNKCMVCVVAKKNSDQNCAAICVQEDTPIATPTTPQ